MDLNDDFKRLFDTSEGDDGKWFDLTDKLKVKLRFAASNKVTPIRRSIEQRYGNTTSEEKSLEMNVMIISKGILLDWKGFEIDGKSADYTPALGYKLLMKYPLFLKKIADLSADENNFLSSSLEDFPLPEEDEAFKDIEKNL